MPKQREIKLVSSSYTGSGDRVMELPDDLHKFFEFLLLIGNPGAFVGDVAFSQLQLIFQFVVFKL